MPSSPISPCPSCPPHAARGHGCAVYSSSVTAQCRLLAAVACAVQHGRPRRTTREALPPCHRGRYPVLVRGGIAWRQLPVQFPPAATCLGVAMCGSAARCSASSTRCATDCGCGPGGTGARPRRSSTRRRCPPPTPCPDPAAAAIAAQNNGVKRHLAVDVNGLRSGRCQHRLSPTATRTPLLAALRGSFSTIGLVWADGGYLGRLLIWAKTFFTLTLQIIKRIPGATRFHVRPRIRVVEISFAWINKHRRCARDYRLRLHAALLRQGRRQARCRRDRPADPAPGAPRHSTRPSAPTRWRSCLPTAGARHRRLQLHAGRPRPTAGRNRLVPAINQIEVHPYFRQSELLAVDTEHGILNQAWAPIGGITFYREGPHTSTLEDPVIGEIAAAALEDAGAGDAALAHAARPPGDPEVRHARRASPRTSTSSTSNSPPSNSQPSTRSTPASAAAPNPRTSPARSTPSKSQKPEEDSCTHAHSAKAFRYRPSDSVPWACRKATVPIPVTATT